MSGCLPLAVARIAWRTGQVVPLVAMLLAALVCGVTLLYLRQTSRTPWRWRVVLLTLRTAALTALALSLLQPTLSRDARPSEQGAVLVVVDRSHSMSLHDRQRQPGQLVALADGLGLIPSGLRSRGDEWLATATDLTNRLTDLTDAQSRLTFARISGLSTAEPEVQVTAATARFEGAARAALERQPAPPPGRPLAKALATLRQAVDQPHGPDVGERWLPAVEAGVEAVTDAAGTFQFDSDQELYRTDAGVRAVCDALATKDRFQLAEEALAHPSSGLLYHLPPGAPLYGFAVGDGVEPLPLRGPGDQPVRRLLVDTDASGMDLATAVRDAIDQMRGAAVRAVVLLSDGRQPRTRETVAAAAPGVPVFAVSAAPLPGPRGPSGKDLSITELPLPAAVSAGETFAARGQVHAVSFPPGSPQQVECLLDGATFAKTTVPLQRGGTDVSFDVRIPSPGPHRVGLRLPGASGEASAENNAAEQWVKVVRPRAPVVTWADAPTWDWRLASDALASGGGFDVRRRTATTMPTSAADVGDARALLLFDLDPRTITGEMARSLDRFVRERGGLLVIAANPDRPLSEYASSSKVMAELLPFSPAGGEWTAWYGDEPVYHFEPPDAPAEGRARYAELPPSFRFASLSPLKPSARPLLVERDGRSPVAAGIAVGSGRVIFVGLDETWRWAYRGAAEAGRFWTDLVREGSEPPYAVTDGPLALDVDRAAVAPREAFGVRAIVPDGPASLALRVLAGDGAEVRRDVLPRATPGRYAATLAGLPAGTYQIELIAPEAGGKRRTLHYPLHVVPSYMNEVDDPSAGRDVLQRLAEASGGRLLAMEELRQLPSLLAGTEAVQSVPVPLWDSTYLFVFVAACFCAEWALRKRLGLG